MILLHYVVTNALRLGRPQYRRDIKDAVSYFLELIDLDIVAVIRLPYALSLILQMK